jgi:hypothetical protein
MFYVVYKSFLDSTDVPMCKKCAFICYFYIMLFHFNLSHFYRVMSAVWYTVCNDAVQRPKTVLFIVKVRL